MSRYRIILNLIWMSCIGVTGYSLGSIHANRYWTEKFTETQIKVKDAQDAMFMTTAGAQLERDRLKRLNDELQGIIEALKRDHPIRARET